MTIQFSPIRIIKFRAWDTKNTGKFRAWDTKNTGWCFYTNADCMNNLNNPNTAITQFTGLLDKNPNLIQN